MSIQTINWKNVSDTLLIPLYCRAKETTEKNPIIVDHKALEILKEIRSSLKGSQRPIHKKILKNKYNSKLVVSLALRTRRFDNYVRAFSEKNKNCTIVNLGCGFDARYLRLKDPNLTWFDLDLPEVIEMKKQLFTSSQKYHLIPASVLDFSWMDTVKANRSGNIMFIAEGLFMYLDEQKTKELIIKMSEVFPGSELVFEIAGKYWVKKMSSSYIKWKFNHQLGIKDDALFRFGIVDHKEIESLGRNITFLDEWSYFDDKEKRLGWFNFMGSFTSLKHVQWTLHFRL